MRCGCPVRSYELAACLGRVPKHTSAASFRVDEEEASAGEDDVVDVGVGQVEELTVRSTNFVKSDEVVKYVQLVGTAVCPALQSLRDDSLEVRSTARRARCLLVRGLFDTRPCTPVDDRDDISNVTKRADELPSSGRRCICAGR